MVESAETRRTILILDPTLGRLHSLSIHATPKLSIEQRLMRRNVIGVITSVRVDHQEPVVYKPVNTTYRYLDAQVIDASKIKDLKPTDPNFVDVAEERQKAIIFKRVENDDAAMPLIYLLRPEDRVIDPNDGSQIYP